MDLTDSEILRRSLDDPRAFGLLFERYHDTIFRYAARRRGIEQAADITAEVFTRAFALRKRFDTDRENCRPWLYGIATNIIGDAIRRQRRSERLYLAMIGYYPDDDDPFVQSEDRITAQQQARRLNAALATLARKDLAVLLLYAVEELSYREVADALNIPIGTVRSRLARARRKIRELEPARDKQE